MSRAYTDGLENQDDEGTVQMTAAERYWQALRELDRLCEAKASVSDIRAAGARTVTARKALPRKIA